ncbi:tyrosine-type recombinase/integrase [Nocardioides sp. T2.26MG-1]|uniref:tyrosine-type recombinase/integrase n=1 Tax=Nocardioides sp. T2.26MG-1 TaxID=3041166 RepID=UPI002477B963|nr:tyrosine-type recombinase/integrase [Nocardioides sp. T2.26MG-1]CAI9417451.1 Tyrosine recombinase XerC [Nocardioides sp. T2.26MG-1]
MLHATRALPALADLTPLQKAYFGYLANYEALTRDLYDYHLTNWFQWCRDHNLDPLTVDRPHVAMYVRYLSEVRGNKASTVGTTMAPIKGFYRYAMVEGLIDRDPAAYVRLPKIHYEKKHPLEREELRRLINAGKELGGRHWAMIELFTVHALRISETCSIDIEDYQDVEKGRRVLHFTRKGGRTSTVPVPVALLLALDDAAAGRTSGPLLTTLDGRRLNRHTATGVFETIVRRAKIGRHVNPHLVRASVITDAFEQGLPGRQVQRLAGHLDPRTTSIYDLGAHNHDTHPAHIMAARLTA